MLIILPNQLYDPKIIKQHANEVILLEHKSFFAAAHKAKIVLHRASMMEYARELAAAGVRVVPGSKKIPSGALMFDPVDKELYAGFKECKFIPNPGFFITDPYVVTVDKKFTSFYIWFRRTFNIMIDNDKPRGGKWSYDTENRDPFPKNYREPYTIMQAGDKNTDEAVRYCEQYYSKNYGEPTVWLPYKRKDVMEYAKRFVAQRLRDFGKYEDAISQNVFVGNHSCLSPLINIGLIRPQDIREMVLAARGVPDASREAFIRQLAWREYVRCCYIKMDLAKNRWPKFASLKIPDSWFAKPLQTGIAPLDNASAKLYKYGYMHHIERLMVCGNFFLLCEFDTNDVYKWFMLCIDAYPWVMIPNIYGMSQDYKIMKRPYMSSSIYVLKMSDYKKGEPWTLVWDEMYKKFVYKYRDILSKIYATASIAHRITTKPDTTHADQFLRSMHKKIE